MASLRAQAESFFIPRREYRVSITAEGRSRFFRARHYAMALTVDNYRDVQRLEWTCLALDPYLYSEESNSFNIVEGRAKRGFPFVSFAKRVAPEPMLRIALEPETHIAGMVASVVSRTLEDAQLGLHHDVPALRHHRERRGARPVRVHHGFDWRGGLAVLA